MTLQRQITTYYVHVVGFTLITSFVLVLATYFILHSIVGFHSLDLKNSSVIEIMEYANENSELILNCDFKRELSRITQKNNLEYYVKDAEDNILYGSRIKNGYAGNSGFVINMAREIWNHSISTSTIDIPLIDDTGKVMQILVLSQSNTTYMTLFICIDVFIPLICLIIYTLVFSKSLSRDIKGPLDELMIGVEKIKKRNLAFCINSDRENEIGDLARAFEEMRNNLKNSLLREWQLEQERREMVSAITHDLRTPLAIIQGHVEGLQDGVKRQKDKLDDYLDTIAENSLRAQKLVNEMNLLAEVDDMGFQLIFSDEDLIEFLTNKLDEMKVLAKRKMIDVKCNIQDTRTVKKLNCFDSGRLSQVINNIFTNSIRFTPRGGNIEFHAKIQDEAASFRICDSGRGFQKGIWAICLKNSIRAIAHGQKRLAIRASGCILQNS